MRERERNIFIFLPYQVFQDYRMMWIFACKKDPAKNKRSKSPHMNSGLGATTLDSKKTDSHISNPDTIIVALLQGFKV